MALWMSVFASCGSQVPLLVVSVPEAYAADTGWPELPEEELPEDEPAAPAPETVPAGEPAPDPEQAVPSPEPALPAEPSM